MPTNIISLSIFHTKVVSGFTSFDSIANGWLEQRPSNIEPTGNTTGIANVAAQRCLIDNLSADVKRSRSEYFLHKLYYHVS